jgi:hypothetical protein
MKADKQKLLLSHFVNVVLLDVGAYLYELLDDIVAEFIVDEVVYLGVKILEYLIFEELVGCLKGNLYVPRTVLIPAPLGHELNVVDNLFLRRIYRKVAY